MHLALPLEVRSRNNYGSLRLAAMLGAAPREFSASLVTGYQHSWVLRGGWQLYWQGGVALTLPKRGRPLRRLDWRRREDARS